MRWVAHARTHAGTHDTHANTQRKPATNTFQQAKHGTPPGQEEEERLRNTENKER